MKAKDDPCLGGCRDEDLTGHIAHGRCGTPYCYGWQEVHCRKCGWYSSSCPCGSCNGAAKISAAQTRALSRREARKIKERA